MPDSLLDQPTVYGSRAKLGMIIPPTNSANEAEWWRLAPADVTVHSVRMPLHTDTRSEAGKKALLNDIRRYCSDLAQVGPDVLVYGCTAGSMVSPPAKLADAMTAFTGLPSITTAQSIVRALRAMGLSTVSVGTPYHDLLNEHEQQFLEDEGFRVTRIEGLGYGSTGPEEYRNIARITPDIVQALAQRVNSPEADAVLLSCTDLATLEIIEPLELALDKPVISSNTATFWHALRTAGVPDAIAGAGRLLTCH